MDVMLIFDVVIAIFGVYMIGAALKMKKTGKISDVTRGRKLMPTKQKPIRPIWITNGSAVKTRSICEGNRRKHSIPAAISARPKQTAVRSVFRQRSIFLAA